MSNELAALNAMIDKVMAYRPPKKIEPRKKVSALHPPNGKRPRRTKR
jgi:hypothetical protein